MRSKEDRALRGEVRVGQRKQRAKLIWYVQALFCKQLGVYIQMSYLKKIDIKGKKILLIKIDRNHRFELFW